MARFAIICREGDQVAKQFSYLFGQETHGHRGMGGVSYSIMITALTLALRHGLELASATCLFLIP